MGTPSDRDLAGDARRELLENILPFWRERTLDLPGGGFIGEMSNDLRVREGAPRGLILSARILWTFAAAWKLTKDDRDLELARRARDYLVSRFLDPEYGGFVWEVAPDGNPLNTSKKIYGQAFCIYALTEYPGTDDDAKAWDAALDAFWRTEAHAFDRHHGGYIETLSRDWKPCEDVRLSDKDMNEKKSMNNHLHLLEAYTSLQRARPNGHWAARLRELIDIFQRRILNPAGTHFDHFFDEAWNVKSDSYTFGHDIEGSWLLCEAAEALGDAQLLKSVRSTAVKIARAVLREGLAADGSLLYEARDGCIINADREWWPQAEAVIGFLNAWQLTGHPDFRDAAVRCWQYIQDRFVDREHGEWFWRILPDGTPDASMPKVSAWKGPYHNGRCCLEIIRRLKDQGSPGSQA